MKSRLTTRDRVYLALGVVAILSNYAIWRGSAHRQTLTSLGEERAELEAERDEVAATAARPLAPLQAAVEDLRAEIDDLQRREAEARSVLAGPEAAADLDVALSELATECGLELESVEAAPAPPEPADDAEPRVGNVERFLRDRPLQGWTLRARFVDLWRFLARLERFPWRVVVVDLAVEQSDDAERAGDLPLRVRMTVAL